MNKHECGIKFSELTMQQQEEVLSKMSMSDMLYLLCVGEENYYVFKKGD